MTHPSPIAYTLRFDHAAQHLIDVTLQLPPDPEAAPGAYAVTLMMPVWTPGSYMVREFARHVEGITAHDAKGTRLSVVKTDKNHWRIEAAAPGPLTVRYRVYARELTVRSNFVDRDRALIQGAATYLTPIWGAAWPHEVTAELPAHWPQGVCGLPVMQQGATFRITAEDFDALVDSPLMLGQAQCETFEVQGVPHTLATFGADAHFDAPRAARDFKAIVEQAYQLFETLPYEKYVMINVLCAGQGGLEHRHSAVIMASPWVMHSEKSYRDFCGLMAHEHFHAFNIKRLRPRALGPFDYNQENYTPSLWVAEGITAYYDNLLVRRAGLCSDEAYLAELARDMSTLERTAGRHVHTLAASSFDAWIKFYRRDENTDNTTVSYYLKGSLVAAVLDARIVLHSVGKQTLDDVMRLALARHSGAQGFTEHEFRACVAEICPELPADFLARAVDTTESLDYTPLAQAYGLLIDRPAPEATNASPGSYVGIAVREEGNRLVVSQVTRGTPGYEAGLAVDDELIAADGALLTTKNFAAYLALARPGKQAVWTLGRQGRLTTVSVTPGPVPPAPFRLRLDPAATQAQRAARQAWWRSQAGQKPG